MKNKLIEKIRQILIKTVIPFRKKKEAMMGKIRLSITYRIAINYLRLLLLNGVLFFFVFILLYLNVEKESFQNLAEQVIVNLEGNGVSFGQQINPYADRGLNLIIFEQESNREVYNDVNYSTKRFGGIFKKIHYTSSNDQYRFVMEEEMTFQQQTKVYRAVFYYNMTESYHKMWKLVINAGLLYLIIVACIIKEGRKDNIKMLEPIKQMSDTVNRLTVNNLHSERLNIEGTKNELKDLEAVFNNMLDRLETSYESQKQFVSDASHELRTPIAVIQGYVNMLNRWGAKDQAVLEESIEAIQNEAKAMQDLVEKLLFLSRHDKKTLKLEKKHFNMRPIVEEMVKETKLVASNRIVECPYLEDVDVYGDKQSLKQAIRVFIDNAAKYTVEGDKIIISCRNVRGDCVITVEDTGIGMTKRDMDNIFSRFYRSHHVRDRKIDGHGLGLSIAKLIIIAHTGRIKVRSQYKKGTSFIVTIPRIRY